QQLPPLPERFLFYPANLYPHKNHETLLQAMRLLRERGQDCACVLTGHPTDPGTPIEERIAAHGLHDRVFWLGHVAPAALRYLYEHAVALCFPSQFEGFGMPLVEAMHCGCPILATPVASIPEVVGDAGLLVPQSAAALADAVERLLAEPRLREELIAKGHARARCFTGQALAKMTLRGIHDAVTRFWQQSPAAVPPRLSYVVRALTGGPALARTLASLCYELRDHDEILVIGDRHRISEEVHTLGDNLESFRFLAAENWIDAVSNEIICYLREGDCLLEGATQTVVDTLAAVPGVQAVVGEALSVTAQGCYHASRFVRPRSRQQLTRANVPPPVVFWRGDFLQQHRELLGPRFRAGALLAQAGSSVRWLERTLAAVETSMEARYDGPGLVRRLAGALARVARRFPGTKRAVVKLLPRRFEAILRGWYVGA